MQEIDEVKLLSHPNIFFFFLLGFGASFVMAYPLTCYVALRVGMSQTGLLSRCSKSLESSEKLLASYVVQALEGLDYLHHNGVMHGNLKAANTLLTQSGDIMLSDFGISLNLQALEDVGEGVFCTPYWTAPEVIGLERASTKSDIWSLGCTIIELLTGQLPYGNLVDDLSGTCSFLYPVRRL